MAGPWAQSKKAGHAWPCTMQLAGMGHAGSWGHCRPAGRATHAARCAHSRHVVIILHATSTANVAHKAVGA